MTRPSLVPTAYVPLLVATALLGACNALTGIDDLHGGTTTSTGGSSGTGSSGSTTATGGSSATGGTTGAGGTGGTASTGSSSTSSTSSSSTSSTSSSSTSTTSSSTSSSSSSSSSSSGTTSQYACPGDASDPLASARQECVKTINNYRATLSLPPLTRWCGNASCEDGQCAADDAANTAHSAFGKCSEFGQCECPGWGGDPLSSIDGCLQAMWNEGPGPSGCSSDPTCFEMHGHYLIMSSTSYSTVECGFYVTSSSGWWGVQDYK